MSGASILAVGGYVPPTRLARATIADVWHGPSVPGDRALAAPDEDAVTMAVEAARSCVRDEERSLVDAVYFASTTAPYAEKQGAAIVAVALDLREDIVTADFADSMRAATAALRAARDAVVSGTARRVLVVAADRRVPEPESMMEQVFGDGAGALLVSRTENGGLAEITEFVSTSEEVSPSWRGRSDPFVRSLVGKHEVEYGFVKPLVGAMQRLFEQHSLSADNVAALAIPSPDGRAHLTAAKAIGIAPEKVRDPLVVQIGVVGTAAPLLALASAFEGATAGDRIVVGAAGEGADAILLHVTSPLRDDSWRPSVAAAQRREVPSYGDYIRAFGLINLPAPRIESSPVTYWRDRKAQLSLHGMRCGSCGLVQYPVARVCQRCRVKDAGEDVALGRTGTVFTYTLDHIVAASYSTIPVARAIIDLDGGGRILTAIVDCDPDDMAIGMAVRLMFRLMHQGGGFRNYYWKAAPESNGSPRA